MTRSPDRAMIRRILSEAFGWDTILLTVAFAVIEFCFFMPEVTHG